MAVFHAFQLCPQWAGTPCFCPGIPSLPGSSTLGIPWFGVGSFSWALNCGCVCAIGQYSPGQISVLWGLALLCLPLAQAFGLGVLGLRWDVILVWGIVSALFTALILCEQAAFWLVCSVGLLLCGCFPCCSFLTLCWLQKVRSCLLFFLLSALWVPGVFPGIP